MTQYKNTTLQQLLIIVIIILLVILIASMWLQKQNKPLSTVAAVAQQEKAATLNTPVPKATAKSAAEITEQQVDFDFYKLLAEQHSTAQAPEKKPTNVVLPAKTAKLAAPTQSYYILQVAATHNLSVAIDFKQHLGTLGYIAVVQSFEREQQLWYRVLIGPYPNKIAAQQVQQRLGQQKMTSLLIPISRNSLTANK